MRLVSLDREVKRLPRLDVGNKSASDVQESENPDVCFVANRIGHGPVFVQIRRKDDNNFAIALSSENGKKVIEDRIGRKKLEKALSTRILEVKRGLRIQLRCLHPIIEIYDAI